MHLRLLWFSRISKSYHTFLQKDTSKHFVHTCFEKRLFSLINIFENLSLSVLFFCYIIDSYYQINKEEEDYEYTKKK